MKKIFLLTLVVVSLFGINNSAQAQNFKLGIDGLTFKYNDKEVPLSEMATEEASEDSDTRVKLTPCINVSKTKLYVWTNGISSIPTLELGWNVLSNVGYNAYTDASIGNFFHIREWKSMQVTVNLLNFNAYNKLRKVGFSAALGIRSNDYRLSSGQSWQKMDGVIMPYTIEPYKGDKSPKKSKFNIASLHIPMEVTFGNPRRFAFSVGGYADLVMNSHTKIKYHGGHKEKVHNFPTNFIQAGATARVSFRDFSKFFSYQPTQIFKTGRGREAQQWTIGIGF